MEDLKRPRIDAVEKVILHILDPPRESDEAPARGFVPSELPLTPDGSTDPRIFDYFRTHLQQTLQDPDLRAARFLTEDSANGIPTLARRLLRNEDFVEGSRQLAEKLYGIMEEGSRISMGDLAVCLCRGSEPGSSSGQFLAVLKIDPAEGFRQVTKRRNGKTYVTLEIVEEIEVLPTTRQPLQKAALVRPEPSDSGYDLLLLDRQARRGGRDVARFFAEKFLTAEVIALGAPKETEVLYEMLLEMKNELRAQLSFKKLQSLEAKIDALLQQDRVRPSDLQALPIPAKQQKAMARQLGQLPRGQVNIDAGSVKNKVKFVGDNGLRVSAPRAFWSDLLHSEKQTTGPGGKKTWEIILRTQTWKEVP